VRLSVVTDEIGECLPAALDVCRELGITTVEIRSVDGRNIVEHHAESIAGIAQLLTDRRLGVCAIASPFLKCEVGDSERAWEYLERSIQVARQLGAPLVRAFSFWRADDPRSVFPRLVPILQYSATRAADEGLRLVIENEHTCNVATGYEAAAIVHACRPAGLGVIWDPANEARHSPAAVSGVGGYAAVRGHVAHVHVKDVDDTGNWVRIGAGVVNHTALLRALKRDGYAGCVSLETHYSIDDSREAATRESLAALRAIWPDTAPSPG
jgi:sugar phosphate isomerase/epimerase